MTIPPSPCKDNLSDRSDKPTTAKPTDSTLLWLFIVGLASAILCLPFVRSVFWMGDEGVLLHGAERILRGNRLYVDFFEFLPPGGFLIAAAWLGIAGTSIWSVRLLAILTIVGIACFTYLACRQASKHSAASALVAIGWVGLSQGFWTQLNHHWFATLFSMVTVWTTLYSVEHPHRGLRGPIVAGIAAGAAAMVTPTRGALAILAGATAFLNLRRYRGELFAYGLGCALIPTALLLFLLYQGAFAAAFDDVIMFPAKQYSSIQSVPFAFSGDNRYWPDYQNWPLKYLYPVVALLTFLICARDWYSSVHDRLLRSCVVFSLAGLAGCFPRPDMAHIAFTAPLVCPLLVFCVTRIILSWSRKRQLAALLTVAAIPSALSFYWTAHRAVASDIVVTPRGGVAFLADLQVRELMRRIAATPSEEGYFFYPYMPMLPFLTARNHVSRYDIFVPNYTLPSQYQEACLSSMRHAVWVVIDRTWTDDVFLKAFPAMRDAAPQEKKMFELALERGFEFVAREGAFEMRRRVKTVDETVCSGISE